MDEITKFGLISYVLKKLGEKRWYYGKIVIQKILYFLQEAENVNLDYRFVFYHYGPYSEELTRDVQLMEINGVIYSSKDPRGVGYAIQLDNDIAEEYLGKASKFIMINENKINNIINDFGRFKPASLELYSTIHFVNKDYKDSIDSSELKKHVVNIVRRMKPKFTPSVIAKSYDKLKSMDYI